jgi:hypothetical protein
LKQLQSGGISTAAAFLKARTVADFVRGPENVSLDRMRLRMNLSKKAKCSVQHFTTDLGVQSSAVWPTDVAGLADVIARTVTAPRIKTLRKCIGSSVVT